MAIRFRCKSCKQLLSIATRKAGQVVRCPSCQAAISVPRLEDIPTQPKETKPPTAERKTSQAEPPPESEAAAPPGPAAADSPPPQAPVETTPEPPETTPEPAEATPGPPETTPPPAETGPTGDEVSAAAMRLPDGAGDEDEGFTLRGVETEFEDMDLTPMVDVTFLLLIFFMITASFSLQKTIQVPPPDPDEQGAAQAMTMQELERDSIIVEIDEKNAIVVDDEPLGDPEGLVDTLQNKRLTENKFELVLEADERALHEYVVMVIDAANEVGMQRIRLATRAEN